MILCATLGIPKGMKKCSFFFYCFLPWLFDQKWKYNFWGMQNKKPFEIILHAGRVTSLKSWKGGQKCNIHLWGFDHDIMFSHPTLKACNSPVTALIWDPCIFNLHNLLIQLYTMKTSPPCTSFQWRDSKNPPLPSIQLCIRLKLFYCGKDPQSFASNVTLYPCERSRQNHQDLLGCKSVADSDSNVSVNLQKYGP